jgi:hypothetical protein
MRGEPEGDRQAATKPKYGNPPEPDRPGREREGGLEENPQVRQPHLVGPLPDKGTGSLGASVAAPDPQIPYPGTGDEDCNVEGAVPPVARGAAATGTRIEQTIVAKAKALTQEEEEEGEEAETGQEARVGVPIRTKAGKQTEGEKREEAADKEMSKEEAEKGIMGNPSPTP